MQTSVLINRDPYGVATMLLTEHVYKSVYMPAKRWKCLPWDIIRNSDQWLASINFALYQFSSRQENIDLVHLEQILQSESVPIRCKPLPVP